jgi:hypothetical protein
MYFAPTQRSRCRVNAGLDDLIPLGLILKTKNRKRISSLPVFEFL